MIQHEGAGMHEKCPDCDGYGYHEDGTDEGVECATCHGDGVIKDN